MVPDVREAMTSFHEDIQRCKDLWESAKVQRQSAHDRVITGIAHFLAGAGPVPTEEEITHLKACEAVEDQATHNYITILEKIFRS